MDQETGALVRDWLTQLTAMTPGPDAEIGRICGNRPDRDELCAGEEQFGSEVTAILI
jgi:hypothetical protein